ncbi:NAD-reducing hydrogenase HoxS subunit delta [Methanobrevibacter woesei]|uniref:NAD-reducing hydrogenase HoxS subunit delta n=1 Tax=Methanobrevibacter woesei TaxID=190976 RepID=A0A2U1S6X4_9EURY|nr:F420-nonreducing hydrogenase [Methanobrevibacter woesei]MCI7291601.1 F420-nonreducing hydrogenase [Methanobrevibacter woesei]PWB85832.1 NAD-reducing hydrogenase HoxS subunit delta [Methanobrevibacter woesei]
MADKVKIGTMWLGGCSGCHLSIADFHESLIDIMDLADFEFSPVLMDTKYDEVPELDVIIVEGGIRNDENRELAEMLNEKAKLVIAYGTCSCYGGIPGLGNLFTVEELEQEAYINSVSTVNPEGIIPNEDVPALESRVRPLDAVMDVDLMIPGCPPRSDVVAEAVLTLLRNETIELPVTNLCEVCPREKPPEGLAMDFIKRQFELGKPEDDLCLISQGLICMGPATVSLCGAECPSIGIPCRGCYGPTAKVLDQGAKMISAIASDYGVEEDKTVDPEQVADQLDDIVGTFYTYTLPAALVPMKMQKGGE